MSHDSFLELIKPNKQHNHKEFNLLTVELLKTAVETHPELRIGQIIEALGLNKDIFYNYPEEIYHKTKELFDKLLTRG